MRVKFKMPKHENCKYYKIDVNEGWRIEPTFLSLLEN